LEEHFLTQLPTHAHARLQLPQLHEYKHKIKIKNSFPQCRGNRALVRRQKDDAGGWLLGNIALC